MLIPLKHLTRDKDRHGNVRIYLRLPGLPKVRLRAQAGTDAFLAEYQAAIARLEAGPAEPTEREGKAVGAPKPGTFRWLSLKYMASGEYKQLAPKTKATRLGLFEHMWDEPTKPGAKEKFRDFPVARMTAKAIMVLRDRKADLPEAANSRLKVLRRLFAWAKSPGVELVTENIARDIPKLRPNRPDGFHAWTVEEVQQYRQRHPIGSKARLALELLLLTTQRRSDVVRLGRQHMRKGAFHLTQVKGAKRAPVTLTVAIHPDLQAAIDLLPAGNLTFLQTEYGRAFTSNGFGNWFRKRCNEAGLPQCSAHGLRKAGSELLAESGATDREIMAVTGHQNAREVDRYTRAVRQRKLAASAIAKVAAHGAGQGEDVSAEDENGN